MLKTWTTYHYNGYSSMNLYICSETESHLVRNLYESFPTRTTTGLDATSLDSSVNQLPQVSAGSAVRKLAVVFLGDDFWFKVKFTQWDPNRRYLLTEALVQKVEAREGRDCSKSSGCPGQNPSCGEVAICHRKLCRRVQNVRDLKATIHDNVRDVSIL